MLRGLHKQHTALLIADFYADQMSKLPHAIDRKCARIFPRQADVVQSAEVIKALAA
ncbi:MAG: hypothetical protein HY322_17270 [Betaproteobacteria bacterium]|nr:hypothetical protein [Betaproteobacteria bacterium]